MVCKAVFVDALWGIRQTESNFFYKLEKKKKNKSSEPRRSLLCVFYNFWGYETSETSTSLNRVAFPWENEINISWCDDT